MMLDSQVSSKTIVSTGAGVLEQVKTVSARLYFIDNLKVLLAILVVMQHAGQPYGPGGAWWVPSEPYQAVSWLVLGFFFSVNMSFFMGLFFMISAYFMPGSYDRKGAGRFFQDRLIRLGVPILIFLWLVFPAMLYLLHGYGHMSFVAYYLSTYLGGAEGLTLGHLWFLEQLLFFAAFYVIWRAATKRNAKEPRKKIGFPSGMAIVAFTAVMGLSMFVMRIWSPINQWVPILSFEPAHYPEYVAMFIAGILVYRNDWLNGLTASTARKWSAVTVAAIVALPIIFVLFGDSITAGGFTLPSLVLSLWESVVCVGISISLVALFRRKLNVQSKLTKALADSSFTVYLIHLPIIVFLQYLLIGVNIPPLAKFALVFIIGVPACFLASHYVVRRLPYARYVL